MYSLSTTSSSLSESSKEYWSRGRLPIQQDDGRWCQQFQKPVASRTGMSPSTGTGVRLGSKRTRRCPSGWNSFCPGNGTGASPLLAGTGLSPVASSWIVLGRLGLTRRCLSALLWFASGRRIWYSRSWLFGYHVGVTNVTLRHPLVLLEACP